MIGLASPSRNARIRATRWETLPVGKCQLRSYGSSVFSARWEPVARRLGQRKLLCQLFVQINPPAGRFGHVHVAVLDRRQAGKDVLRGLVELDRFLNAEIVYGQIQVGVGSVANWREICRP